jgi:hypothetical protein
MAKPLAREPLIETLRRAIETAERDGVDREAMTLRLTLRDTTNLRRDNTIPLDDIRFVDGEMRLLSVRVVSGGVAASALDLGGGEAAELGAS